MISTIRFHSVKELNIKDRRPFWILPVALIILAAVALHPPVVLFVMAVSYVVWAIIEYILTFNKRRAKIKAQ
jgi:CDP-diacylglycerol--serine O-phosphatidyltransferase